MSSPARIGITALGAVTALGPDVVTSCAAARAGLSRAAALDVMNFSHVRWGGEPPAGHAIPGALPGGVGVAKLIALGRRGLADLTSRLAGVGDEAGRCGLYLALPDCYLEHRADAEDTSEAVADPDEAPQMSWPETAVSVTKRLAMSSRIRFAESHLRTYCEGHLGVLSATRDALRELQTGNLDRCVVGGIDCLIEPRALLAAAHFKLIKTAAQPAGYMPGEAAAFFMLERADSAAAMQRPVPALIEGSVKVRDGCDRLSGAPPLGAAISRAIATLAERLDTPSKRFDLVVSDLNGDPIRAQHWGAALVSLHKSLRLGDLPSWIPAMGFGETGAATGGLAIAIVVRSIERGYTPGRRSLIWLWGEEGIAGALSLHAARN